MELEVIKQSSLAWSAIDLSKAGMRVRYELPCTSTLNGLSTHSNLLHSVLSNSLLFHNIVQNLPIQSRYRFALVLRKLSYCYFEELVLREKELYRKARQMITTEGSLEKASTFLSSRSLFMGKLLPSSDHWELWLCSTDSEKITLWSQLEECERVEIWFCATKSQRNFLFCNLPLMEKWSTIVHTSKTLLQRQFYLGLDPTIIRGLDLTKSACQNHIDKILWNNMIEQQKMLYLKVKQQKVKGRATFLNELVQLKYSQPALNAALLVTDPTWSSMTVVVWKHLSKEGKLQIMTNCVRGWNHAFFKEIARGCHGADALQAVLQAESMDWKDLDPLLWPALHNSNSRKQLLIGCWVRTEVQDFFRNLFNEKYGDLPVCLAVAADKPDLNPICHSIWPHLNKKGKKHLLICQYGGNFLSPCSRQLLPRSSLCKILSKAIDKSGLLQQPTIPTLHLFCNQVWSLLTVKDRTNILKTLFPGRFYQDLLDGKMGEKSLNTALESPSIFIEEDWVKKIWIDLSPNAKQLFLSRTNRDYKKDFFFGQLNSTAAVEALSTLSYEQLNQPALIRTLWPHLTEKLKVWWVQSGYEK